MSPDFPTKAIFKRPDGPPSKFLLTLYVCPSCDDRGSCTASEVGFAEHCCRVCAETNGKQHSRDCDRFHRPLDELAVVPTIGDRLSLSVMTGRKETQSIQFGEIVEAFEGGAYMLESAGGVDRKSVV